MSEDRSTPRVGRPPTFHRDAVIAAAVEVLAERGLDGLTMRRLSEKLGTTPPTLYRHVESYDDVVNAAIDFVLGLWPVPPLPDPDGIRDWLLEVIDALRVLMLQYPGVAYHLLLNGPTGPNGLDGMGKICAVLAMTGRDPQQVGWAYSWLMTNVSAYVSKEDRLDRAGGAELVAKALTMRAEHHDDSYLIEVLYSFSGNMEDAYLRSTRLVVDALLA